MAILQKLKSLLGFDESDSERGGAREVGVTVERERSNDDAGAADEGATEPPQSAAAGSTASGSTESLTDDPDRPAEAAEPAEATGPETEDAAPTTEPESPVEEAEPDADATAESEPAEPESETADGADDAADEEAAATDSDAAEESAAEPALEESVAEAEADDDVDDDTEPDTEPEPENQEPVDSIKGIGPAYADRLAGAGVETVGELAVADAADLAEQTDISEKRIQGWIDRAEVR
ncbi:hypothetical protein HTG_15485 [Natrinema mahii]|nr:hypothetical protein HTG_15485 [Natrinema mahii]